MVNLIINNSGISGSSATSYAWINADTLQLYGESASAYYDIIPEKADASHVIVRLRAKGGERRGGRCPDIPPFFAL